MSLECGVWSLSPVIELVEMPGAAELNGREFVARLEQSSVYGCFSYTSYVRRKREGGVPAAGKGPAQILTVLQGPFYDRIKRI